MSEHWGDTPAQRDKQHAIRRAMGYGDSAQLERVGVPAQPDELIVLRHTLADWANGLGVPDERIEALTLATYEALANGVEHAYDVTGTLDLRARYLADVDRMVVTVTDHGHWRLEHRNRGPFGGRGLPLMRQLADDVQINAGPSGTTVQLCWNAIHDQRE